MKKIILKVVLFCLPLLIPYLLFVVIDPFMVIGKNRGRIKITGEYDVTWNRDFQSTELFLKNYDKQKYNSFIMGNSRSFFYSINSWKNYIQGNSFHFNGSSESLFGIERKLQFLKTKKIKIKNLFIILDYSTLLKTDNSEGHLFIKHPIISEESYIYFYLEMFKGFFPKASISFIDLYLTGKSKIYMAKFGVTSNVLRHNLKSNQLTYYKYDSIINNNPDEYYNLKKNIFFERDSVEKHSPRVIFSEQKNLLMNIKQIASINNTECKIIISPLYDQKKINRKDLYYLETVFNKKNVFDFSGKNKFTVNYKNYYETSHYRPNVCDEIMSIVYSEN